MPYLELNGVVHELSDRETTVGSGAQATWRLQSHDLAARHFIVVIDPASGAELHPCSPQSVVVVNGEQVSAGSARLRPGDVIAAGGARFRYVDDPSSLAVLAAAPAEPAAAAHLIDERARGAYPLTHRTTTIGRDVSSVIRLKDPRVSRFHADIRMEADSWVLYPMGASGTVVNGQRVAAPHALREGDRVTIGGASFRFTQAPLPSDVQAAEAVLELNDPQAMRATLLHQAVTTGEHPTPEAPSRLWLLAIVAVALAIIGWMVLH